MTTRTSSQAMEHPSSLSTPLKTTQASEALTPAMMKVRLTTRHSRKRATRLHSNRTTPQICLQSLTTQRSGQNHRDMSTIFPTNGHYMKSHLRGNTLRRREVFQSQEDHLEDNRDWRMRRGAAGRRLVDVCAQCRPAQSIGIFCHLQSCADQTNILQDERLRHHLAVRSSARLSTK